MKTNRKVVKSNALNESRQRLTMQSQKTILVLIAMINNKDKKLKRFYQISWKELAFFLGITSSHNAKEQITKALIRINKRPVWINSKLMVYWFASCEWKDDGFVEFEFSEKLQNHLINIESRFTQYQLYNILPLKAAHSIRIYELMKQYIKVKERTLSLEDLKQMIGLDENAYGKWHDFKKRILLPSKDEIYQQTDIGFNFYPLSRGKGKAVTHVRFTIFPSDKQKAKKWMERKELIERLAESKKANYIIPGNSLNTATFDNCYKNFLDNKSNFMDEITFETYVDDLGYNIVHLKNGNGKDLQAYGQQKLIN